MAEAIRNRPTENVNLLEGEDVQYTGGSLEARMNHLQVEMEEVMKLKQIGKYSGRHKGEGEREQCPKCTYERHEPGQKSTARGVTRPATTRPKPLVPATSRLRPAPLATFTRTGTGQATRASAQGATRTRRAAKAQEAGHGGHRLVVLGNLGLSLAGAALLGTCLVVILLDADALGLVLEYDGLLGLGLVLDYVCGLGLEDVGLVPSLVVLGDLSHGLDAVGLLLLVHDDGVGKPGLDHKSAIQGLVLAVLCPDLVLGALGLGLVLGALGGIALDEVLLLCPGLVLDDVLLGLADVGLRLLLVVLATLVLGLVLATLGLVLVLGVICLGLEEVNLGPVLVRVLLVLAPHAPSLPALVLVPTPLALVLVLRLVVEQVPVLEDEAGDPVLDDGLVDDFLVLVVIQVLGMQVVSVW